MQNGVSIDPPIQTTTYADDYRVSVNTGHEVAAGATDASVPVASVGTISEIFLTLVDASQTGKITAKVNGDTVAFNLDPFIKLSEDITSLTVSNSDADNMVKIAWYAVVS